MAQAPKTSGRFWGVGVCEIREKISVDQRGWGVLGGFGLFWGFWGFWVCVKFGKIVFFNQSSSVSNPNQKKKWFFMLHSSSGFFCVHFI